MKQARVCSALGVTTGAFYHSFGSWKDFSGQLLDYWLRERTNNLVALAETESDPVGRLLVLLEVTLQLPHRAEAAIRVWSLLDPAVAEVQATVDRQRAAVVREAVGHLVAEDEVAPFTETAMMLLVGFEQQRAADPEVLRWGLQLLLETALASGSTPDRLG